MPPGRVSILATPDSLVYPVSGMFEVLQWVGAPAAEHEAPREPAPFAVEIVGPAPGPMPSASGLPIVAHRGIDEVGETDACISRIQATIRGIEEISWAVGYEDPASFRRLFKRLTGLTAGEYRRRFRLPGDGQALWPEPLRR